MNYVISAFNFALEVFKSADYLQTGIFAALLCSIVIIILEKQNKKVIIFSKIVLTYIAAVFIFTFVYYLIDAQKKGLDRFTSRAYEIFKWNDVVGILGTWNGIFTVYNMTPGFIRAYAPSLVVCILAITSCVILKQNKNNSKIGIGMILVSMIIVMSPAIVSMNINCGSFEMAGDSCKIGQDVNKLQKIIGANSVLVPRNYYNRIKRSPEKSNVCILDNEDSVTGSIQQCTNSKITYVLIKLDADIDVKYTKDMITNSYQYKYISDIGKYSLFENTN